ncbi:MAG: GNAT family N-acetyltransferase [Deltaproteobacteria bacterium]|nr:GNAT family N-acetyltransferase [Deltaproteobacteria bacterium]
MSEYIVSIGDERLDLNEVIEFLSRIFGPNYFEASFMQRQIVEHEPSLSTRNFILARARNGQLIGVVRVVERQVLLDGVSLQVGGISSLGVTPEWRQRGVASNLMNEAISAMASRGMDFSILFGRRAVDGFYTRFGYYGIGRYIDLELLSYPKSQMSVHDVPLERKKQELCMKLYSENYHGLSGSVLRDDSIWDFLLMRIEKKIGQIRGFLIEEAGGSVGYFITANNRLIEIAVPKQFFPSMPSLLLDLGIQYISTHPRHAFYTYCRTQMNTIQKERFALDGGYMARILNPQSLLRKMGSTLAARAALIGKSDESISIFDCQIDLGNGHISGNSRENDIIFDRKDTAIQFLLGVISPHDIVGVHWTNEKPWIPFLFPELYYHTSAWDEV